MNGKRTSPMAPRHQQQNQSDASSQHFDLIKFIHECKYFYLFSN